MTDMNGSVPPLPSDLPHAHLRVLSVRLSALSHLSSGLSLLQDTPHWPPHYRFVISLEVWQDKRPTSGGASQLVFVLCSFLPCFMSSAETLWGFDQD